MGRTRPEICVRSEAVDMVINSGCYTRYNVCAFNSCMCLHVFIQYAMGVLVYGCAGGGYGVVAGGWSWIFLYWWICVLSWRPWSDPQQLCSNQAISLMSNIPPRVKRTICSKHFGSCLICYPRMATTMSSECMVILTVCLAPSKMRLAACRTPLLFVQFVSVSTEA